VALEIVNGVTPKLPKRGHMPLMVLQPKSIVDWLLLSSEVELFPTSWLTSLKQGEVLFAHGLVLSFRITWINLVPQHEVEMILNLTVLLEA
jgi:hypothetical protein